MGLMRRDTLQSLHRVSRKFDFSPTTQMVHNLVDHGIAALDEIEGGKSTIELRAELKERERQIGLALADLREALSRPDISVSRARLMSDLIIEMLKARGPKWHREWDWYKPRIAEEFGE